MKKIFVFAALPVFLAGVLTGCKTTKDIALTDYSPLAVISVVGNRNLPWTYDIYNEEDDGDMDKLSDLVTRLIDSKNPELITYQDRIDYAEESIHYILPDLAGVEILDKKDVVESEAYDFVKKSYFNGTLATAIADGYKDITTINGKRARILIDELGVNGLLIFNFTFRKDMIQGSTAHGKIAAYVQMNVKLINDRGREVTNREIIARSTHTVLVEDGHYSKEQFVELMPEAIDSAITQYAISFPR